MPKLKYPKTKTLVTVTALLSLCLTSLLGWSSPLKAEEERLSLMVWTWSNEVDNALDRAIEEYEEQNDITISLKRIDDRTKSHIEYNYRLMQAFILTGTLDIMWISDEWMTDRSLISHLSPFDDVFGTEEPETVLGISSEFLLPYEYWSIPDEEFQLYGVPIGEYGDYAEHAYALSQKAYNAGKGEQALEFIMFLRDRIPLIPADFTFSHLSISPEEVGIGEEVTISALVTNIGNISGSYEVNFKVNDAVICTEQVTLDGGASQTVTCTTSSDSDGTYLAVVGDQSGIFTVNPEAAVAFNVDDLFVTPDEAKAGEQITIGALVTNTGNTTGSHEVTFSIDDTVVHTEEVTIDAGKSQMVTYTTTIDEAGSYNVAVNGTGISYTVAAKGGFRFTLPTIKWPTIGLTPILGAIAAAVAGGVAFAVFHLRKARRRKEWQEIAKEEEPEETIVPGAYHCRREKLQSEGARFRIRYLNLDAVNSISEEVTNRKVRGEVVDWLNNTVITPTTERTPEEIHTKLEHHANNLLQNNLKWLSRAGVPKHLTISANLEGDRVTYQYTLYKSKQKDEEIKWEKADKWKATIDFENDELVGTLRRFDPLEPRLPERQAELVEMLKEFIEKVKKKI